jgi:hypothetical protein
MRWCLAALVAGSLAVPFEAVGHAYDMQPGETINMGSCLLSTNGQYGLCAHDLIGTGFYGVSWSGVVCSIGLHYFWDTVVDNNCSNGYGSHSNQSSSAGSNGFASMQSDGNFVLYTAGASAKWATNTNGYGSSAFLSLQDDANLVVYYNTNVPVWSIF